MLYACSTTLSFSSLVTVASQFRPLPPYLPRLLTIYPTPHPPPAHAPPATLHLHSLAINRDKVVENDERHGSYTKPVCEVCKCVIRDHFVLIVDSLTAVSSV